MKKLLAITIIILFASCTKNERARSFGGEQVIQLESGSRLINLTWKDTDLWILTKKDSTKPSIYYFKEKSTYGIFVGQITIIEK